MTKRKTGPHLKSGPKGGPIKLTKEQISQVEKLAAYLTQEQMADFFGICRTTFYEIKKRNPLIAELYKKGRAKCVGSISQSLLQQARAGNTSAAIFYLKTQAGWKETQVIDNTSSDGSMHPTRIEIVAPAPKEQDKE